MNSDFKDLLRNLVECGAEFMIIGGYAVIRYTEPRYTKDLDLLISPTSENANKIYGALKKFGAPLFDLTPSDLTVDGNFFQIGLPPNRVDIIVAVPGVNFDEAFKRAERIIIDNLSIPIMSLDDLVQAKLAAGRPQDLVDAGALTRAKLKLSKSKT